MQDLSSLSVRELLALIITSATGGGAIGAFFQWLLHRKKTQSESVHITAQSVKVEAEARQISTQTIIDAHERIVEQSELIATLRDHLVEANRVRDNFEFELKQERYAHSQLKIRSELREHFIEQLEAANKLGIRLQNLPHKPKDSPDE